MVILIKFMQIFINILIPGKEKVGIVFDNMVVNRHNMKMIPSIYETLKR